MLRESRVLRPLSEAKILGLPRYFTGKPCLRGHIAERYVVHRECVECYNARRRAKYAEIDIELRKANRREQGRHWRKQNPGRQARNSKRWRNAHPDIVSQLAKQRWALMPREARIRLAAKRRERYAEDPEKGRAATRSFLKANPHLRRRWQAHRRARECGAEGFFTDEDVARIAAEQNGRCCYCGEVARLTIEHKIALANGGTNWPSNIALACQSCNSSKRDRPAPGNIVWAKSQNNPHRQAAE